MKVVLWALGIFLFILVLAGVGAAWYYSNLIIDGAEVKGPTEDFEHEVLLVEGTGPTGTITYTAGESIEDPAVNTYTRSVTGMAFPDGSYLQLQQDAVVDGREITRSYLVLEGELPRVGVQGQYDWDSYPSAESLGAEAADVTYDAPGGPTPATVVQPAVASNGAWVVVAHGRNSSIREGLRAVPLYAERGMTTMLINYRDDLKEVGAPYEDGIGNFGYTEWEDVEAAVQYALDAGAEEIVLAGWSMGGALVGAYLENGANTEAVVATQLDSPAMSFSDAVIFQAELRGIPAESGLFGPIIWLAQRFTEMRVSIDFEASEFKDDAATWPVTAAVTAASLDETVSPESIAEFAEALPDGEFLLVDGATHLGEWNLESTTYNEFIGGWLDEQVLPLVTD